MKNVLITGSNSYIGKEFARRIKNKGKYNIEFISLRNNEWREKDFSNFDAVLHLAAIVHKKENKDNVKEYDKINYILTKEIAEKSVNDKVKHFIFMSTMSVYGEQGDLAKSIVIEKNTLPCPKNEYAKSKLKAENFLLDLNAKKDELNLLIVRPPMVYGDNCPGNYKKLEKLSNISPFFPFIKNERSVISVNKLCEYLEVYIDGVHTGLVLPQDDEYMNTSLEFKKLRTNRGKKTFLSKRIGLIIFLFLKKANIVKKIFGNLVYSKNSN